MTRRAPLVATATGRAQVSVNGTASNEQTIQLHHTIQKEPGPLAEAAETFHRKNAGPLHINPSNKLPSGVDRGAFRGFREEYWSRRAGDFTEGF